MADSRKHRVQDPAALRPPSATSPMAIALVAFALVAMLVPPVSNQNLGMDLIAAWVGLAGVVAGVFLLVRTPTPWPRTAVATSWAVFLAWLLISALFSGRVWASLVGEPTNRVGWMTLVALSALGFAAAVLSSDISKLLRQNAWWVVLAECAITLFRLSGGPDAIIGGTLPNSTYLGEALLLLLPWTLPDASVTSMRDRRLRYAVIGIAIVTLGAVQSRAALILAGIWVVWVLARQWQVAPHLKVAALVALIAIGFGATTLALPASVFDPDGGLPLGGRLAAWGQSALAVSARPVTGWGPDSYWPGVAAVRTLEVARESASLTFGPGATDPHNVLVWVALSGGVVGLALWVWFASGVVRTWRKRVAECPSIIPAVWGVGLCFAAGMVAPVILHVWPLVAIVLGASLGRDADARDEVVRDWVRPAGQALLAVAVLAGLVLSLNALTRAQYEITTAERSPGVASGASSASALWFADAHLAYLSSLHAGWAAQADPLAGWQQRDLAALDRAVRLDRCNAFYALERARAVKHYLLPASDVENAFEDVFWRYPAYPLARAEYAVYLAQSGQPEQAREQLAQIADIDDGDPERTAAIEAAESALAIATP